MNYSFYTKKIILLILASCWFLTEAKSQNSTIEVFHETILKNGVFSDTFLHYHAAVRPQRDANQTGAHGISYFNPSNNGNNNGPFGAKGYPATNHFFYKPATGFIGRDTVIVDYFQQFGNGSNLPAHRIYYFTVVPSFLKAIDDYVSTTEGQSVEIPVLINDIGNGTNQTIAGVTNINNGNAVLTAGNTKVMFTPEAGFRGIANLNYSICDAQGSCSFAVVNICVIPSNPPSVDTVQIFTNKNTRQVLLSDMTGGFEVVDGPDHGALDTLQTLGYVPNTGYTGSDEVIFENANGDTRVVKIKVFNVPSVSDLLFNDIVYTPKNTTIEEIHLLGNDNGAEYLVNVSLIGGYTTDKGGTLVYLPNIGKGVYRYTPPTGFKGIDKFKYRAMAPNGPYDTATCYIVVDDLNPVLPTFHITTPKNSALVLGDHLPFDEYSYDQFNSNTQGGGTLAFYAGFSDVTSEFGQEFSGVNMLVYEPEEDFVGTDEFEFEYCADGVPGGCKLVKVIADVVEISNPQSDTLCAGNKCVWAGDTNMDGAVDVRDVLPIGLCMGEVGITRTNGSLDWYGQSANDWNSLFVTGLGYDPKHIDADGDGIISSLDTSAIGQHYGNYHNLTPESISALENLPFYIEEPNFPENLEVGDVFYAPIGLGSEAFPAINAYGLAFELLYDPSIFEVNILFDDNTWMDYNSPILSKTQKSVPGKVDAAYTRTSGLAASGFGHIGVAEFIVIDDLSGVRPDKAVSKVTLNSLGLMNGNGQTMGLNGNSFTVELGGSNGKQVEEVEEDQLMVYPNPASKAVTLHLNGLGHEMERVMVYNAMGGLVYDSGKMTAKRMMVNVADYAPGMYTVKVLANGKVLNKKIEVIK